MGASRLNLALEGGGLDLPSEGRIAVLGPRAGMDLSALDRDRVDVIQRFRPDHDAFAAAGWNTAPEPPEDAEGRYAAAIVVLPRARAEARDAVARAESLVARGGPVVVDGQKTDGADALLRALRARVAVAGPINKAHGKLFWFSAAGALSDWRAPPRQRVADGFVTAPGVFSADGPDAGSVLLARALPARMPAHLADLGAGWGWLAAAALTREGVEAIDLVEADHLALACARENVRDPRARFHWADATRWRPETPLGGIVMNPPFHGGRAADPSLGRAFIAAAAACLAPTGRLWLVANRHLPYEATLAETFAQTAETGGDARFKILEAARPRRAR